MIVTLYMERPADVRLVSPMADSKYLPFGCFAPPHATCASSCVIRSLARRAYSSVTSMPVAE